MATIFIMRAVDMCHKKALPVLATAKEAPERSLRINSS